MLILVELIILFICERTLATSGVSYHVQGHLKGVSQLQNDHHEKCERITVTLCQDAPYNYTRMPNLLGHTDQHMVSLAVQEYKPLIEVQCSDQLKFFLCSIFTPMCTEHVDIPITSCRSVCEEVKSSCLPLLKNFGFGWPDMLNCSQFLPRAPGSLCMDPKQASDTYSKNNGKHTENGQKNHADQLACPHEFVQLAHVATDSPEPCALACKSNWMFDEEHKNFAKYWMAAWSALCIAITAFTVITFLMDTSRFRYPERSIVFLSICYNLYAWGYVLRLIFGFEQSSCQQPVKGDQFLIKAGLDNPKCVITFMILYYFGTASAIWWVVLTFTWFLAAAKKWGQEAIAAASSYFHLAAWGLPALLTIAVLITHQVDASELTGLCFVGQRNSKALVGFVIAPMALFLTTGIGFIAAGFVAMIRIRQEIRNRARDTSDLSKLEKLMVKIGIFAMLYVVPALIVIGCSIYEKSVLDTWTYSKYASFCTHSTADAVTLTKPTDSDTYHSSTELTEDIPRILNKRQAPSKFGSCWMEWRKLHGASVEVYILKIFMSLIVGITSGMWVWSRKTCVTWHRCRLLAGPTGAKTVLQYPQQSASSAVTVGLPLLAASSQPNQQLSSNYQQYSNQRGPSTSSYRSNQQRHANNSHLQMHTYPAPTGFPSAAYTTTASSEASAKM